MQSLLSHLRKNDLLKFEVTPILLNLINWGRVQTRKRGSSNFPKVINGPPLLWVLEYLISLVAGVVFYLEFFSETYLRAFLLTHYRRVSIKSVIWLILSLYLCFDTSVYDMSF